MNHEKIDELLKMDLVVINIGLPGFTDNMEKQEVKVIQVDWIPPAGGDAELMDILDKIL
jgi:hypothetical protein